VRRRCGAISALAQSRPSDTVADRRTSVVSGFER
jgi:hypothetical protein